MTKKNNTKNNVMTVLEMYPILTIFNQYSDYKYVIFHSIYTDYDAIVLLYVYVIRFILVQSVTRPSSKVVAI